MSRVDVVLQCWNRKSKSGVEDGGWVAENVHQLERTSLMFMLTKVNPVVFGPKLNQSKVHRDRTHRVQGRRWVDGGHLGRTPRAKAETPVCDQWEWTVNAAHFTPHPSPEWKPASSCRAIIMSNFTSFGQIVSVAKNIHFVFSGFFCNITSFFLVKVWLYSYNISTLFL